MEILAIKTGLIQKRHQPIHPIAGARRIRVMLALTELLSFITQLQRMGLHHGVWHDRIGPFPQAPQALGKGAFARG